MPIFYFLNNFDTFLYLSLHLISLRAASENFSLLSTPPCGICQKTPGLSIRFPTKTLFSELSKTIPTPILRGNFFFIIKNH